MLENIAFYLVNRSEGELAIFGLVLIAVGFLVGLGVGRGTTLSFRRVPYFILSAAVFGLGSALPLAWLLTLKAASNGVLWVLVLLVFGAIFASGIACGVLGYARSVNAYGNGSRAWMAIVPFVNLALLAKRPLDWTKTSWRKFAGQVVGVVFGVFLMALGIVLGKVAEQAIEGMANDPEMQQSSVDAMLLNRGLEATLDQMAAEVPSQRVDETTTLLRVEGDGTTLRYIYARISQVTEPFDAVCILFRYINPILISDRGRLGCGTQRVNRIASHFGPVSTAA